MMGALQKTMARLQDFGALVRLSHTVFALPFALGSLWMASGGMPSLRILVLVLVCMVAARNSAMAFNRLVDARLDAANPRTNKRHIPSGRLSPRLVLAFLLCNGMVFCTAAFFLNPLAAALALPTWLALLFYSFWKRFSWLCHYYLGFSIGLSPLGAWVAARGELSAMAAALSLLLLLWIAGFDIIYSLQDEGVDRDLGLHSVPVRFGAQGALRIAMATHGLMWICNGAFGYWFALGTPWLLQWVALGVLLAYIHFWRKSNDLDTMNRDFFLANAGVSLLAFGALLWISLGANHAAIS